MSKIGFVTNERAAQVTTQGFGYLYELVERADSYMSAITGLGILGRDTQESYIPQGGEGIPDEYASRLGRKNIYAKRLIGEIVEDALKKGWTFSGYDHDALNAIYKKFKIPAKVKSVDKLSRQFGEAYIWVVTNEPPDKWSQALPQTFRLENLIIVDKREVTPNTWVRDASNARVGEPETYSIDMAQGASANQVHHTRLIRFIGHEQPRTELMENGGWHDSVLTLSETAIRRWTDAEQSHAQLVKELKLSAVKIDQGNTSTTDDVAAAKAAKKMGRINRYKSLLGMIVLGLNEDFMQVGVPLSGLKDLVQALAWGLSASMEGMPLVKIFGMAPAGLSTDDAAGTRNWNDRVASHQDEKLDEPLELLHDVLFRAVNLGLAPPAEDWSISWPTISEPTEEEAANHADKATQILVRLKDAGFPMEVLLEAMAQDGQWRTAAPNWSPASTSNDMTKLMTLVQTLQAVSSNEIPPDVGAELISRTFEMSIEQAKSLVETAKSTLQNLTLASCE